jgi:type I restriction enzyme S subunit
MQISQDWGETILGEVATFIGGAQPPKSDFISEGKEGYIRLLQIRDYKTDNYKTYIPIDKARRFCSKDDVMIGRYGPPVFQILRGLEGSYNVALMKAEPVDGVDKNFLYYLLKQDALFRLIDGLSQRTAGQSGVDIDALKNYPVLLPPLTEQKRIAAILDKADSLRRKRQQAIQLADQFLRTVFLDMFGDPVTNSKGWEIKNAASVIKLQGGYAFKSIDFNDVVGVPVVKIGNANKAGFTVKDIAFVHPENPERLEQYELYPSDLLMSLTGTVGKDDYGNITEVSCDYEMYYLNQRVAKIELIDKKVTKNYIKYYFGNDKVKAEIVKSNRGVRQANISNSDIYNLQIPIPTNDVLKKFDSIVHRVNNYRENIQQFLNDNVTQFNSLSQKAFAGEL